ncbi:MAG: hypothetical protein IJV19_03560 [Prevotella sp.]|nr:hypothetical protein [Prevotella sp.]
MTENYIQIRQREHTEQKMKEWLSDVLIEEDTIYAILYVPMDCPRCEAAIPNFWEKLKHVDSKQKMLLIAVYPDSLLASEYNKRNVYEADAFLYDASENYKNIFSTNMSGGLMGLHLLKIDRKNGNLIVGGQYTVLNNAFIRQMIDCTEAMEKVSWQNEPIVDSDYTTIPSDIHPLTSYHDYSIDQQVHISTLFDVPKFTGQDLFFTDALQNGVMVFKQDGDNMRYRGLLQVNDNEKNRFIEVSNEKYEHLLAHKMLFYMALGTNMLDGEHLGISYSIPRVVYDGNENSIGLYNEPVIISRNIRTLQPDSMVILNFDLEHDTTFFNTHFYFIRHKNMLIMGCKKLTWPMEYEREDYEFNKEMNPFKEDFYRYMTPFVAAFDINDGNLLRRYGNLSRSQEQSLTGYYFVNPVFASHKEELLYSDGRSGNMTITSDKGTQQEEYNAFAIDYQSFPRPDSTLFYTYDYAKNYTPYFNRYITDVKFNDRYIYCIVKYAKPDSDDGARYVYTIIDRKDKTKEQYKIPEESGNIIGCGLHEIKDGCMPFILVRDKQQILLREFHYAATKE